MGDGRDHRVVCDVAAASAAVPWRRPRHMDRIAGGRTEYFHLAVQFASVRLPRGMDVRARRRRCRRHGAESKIGRASRAIRKSGPAMIAGMRAADELSAGPIMFLTNPSAIGGPSVL